jgi:hypothetical protein
MFNFKFHKRANFTIILFAGIIYISIHVCHCQLSVIFLMKINNFKAKPHYSSHFLDFKFFWFIKSMTHVSLCLFNSLNSYKRPYLWTK